MAAATIDLDHLEIAVTGLRRLGGADRVRQDDRFHLGSVTKSMTATVAASLVRDGVIRWTTKLADVLPEAAAAARPSYRDLTLSQLLQHRTGLPGFGLFADLDSVPPITGTASERRRAFATWVVTQAAETNVGEFGYSNAGYVVAAAMLERATGKSWETLIAERLFTPLGLTHAGLGWPAASGAPAPVGHYTLDNGVTLNAHDDVGEPFPELMSPAGNVSMSIGDFARYAQAHLRGLSGRDDLLPASLITTLHTGTFPEIAPGANYAYGWVTTVADGVRTDLHNGSADTFFALMAVQPDGRAAVAVANAATDRVDEELTALVTELVSP
jgi:D-alanyl-D-alanine carboxypeptidase